MRLASVVVALLRYSSFAVGVHPSTDSYRKANGVQVAKGSIQPCSGLIHSYDDDVTKQGSEACLHSTLSDADDISSLLQAPPSTRPLEPSPSVLTAQLQHVLGEDAFDAKTTHLLLRKWKTRLFFTVGSVGICFLAILVGGCALKLLWPEGWSEEKSTMPEATPEATENQHSCHGFSSCCDVGQTFVGNREEILEEQKKFRCRILTMAVVGATTILILTLWSSQRTGSLVLTGDGVHLFSDVITYSVLLCAEVASSRWKGDVASYTFGYARAEVLITFITLSVQYYAMAQLLWRAIDGLHHPQQLTDDAGENIMLLGLASLITNTGIGAWMHLNGICLAHDHSTEGGAAAAYAKLHLLCDAAQNLIVLVTGLMVWWKPQLTMIEPMCTMFFVVFFYYGTSGFLIQMIDILMERAPRNIDCKSMQDELQKINGVQSVHCLHVWALAPGKICAAVHLRTVDSNLNNEVFDQAQIVLQHRYGIKHSALQVSDDDTV